MALIPIMQGSIKRRKDIKQEHREVNKYLLIPLDDSSLQERNIIRERERKNCRERERLRMLNKRLKASLNRKGKYYLDHCLDLK